MSLLHDLRAEAGEKLTIKVAKLEAPDGTIDVGETFRVVFRVRNGFSRTAEVDRHAIFRHVSLDVKGTKFAEVVGGDRTIPVAEALPAGEVVHVEVALKAVGKFPHLVFAPELDIREPYVEYRLHGQFDLLEYLRVEQTGKASTQITKGGF
jgi:hypothetical protein